MQGIFQRSSVYRKLFLLSWKNCDGIHTLEVLRNVFFVKKAFLMSPFKETVQHTEAENGSFKGLPRNPPRKVCFRLKPLIVSSFERSSSKTCEMSNFWGRHFKRSPSHIRKLSFIQEIFIGCFLIEYLYKFSYPQRTSKRSPYCIRHFRGFLCHRFLFHRRSSQELISMKGL